MPWPADGDPTKTEEHLVERYAPSAPAAVKRTAAALVRAVLPADSTTYGAADRAGTPQIPPDVSQVQESGQGSSFRDPLRGSALRRSGAAGILAPWRTVRARKVEADDD